MNINWKAAGLYLALTTPREDLDRESLGNFVPVRKPVRGRKPTVRNKIISGPLPGRAKEEPVPAPATTQGDPEEDSGHDQDWEQELRIGANQDSEPTQTNSDKEENWSFLAEPGASDKKKMIWKVLEVAIKTTFGNHIYLFHNKLFKQLKGGPIGL